MNGLRDSVDIVLENVDYVVSDTHLGHENIIEYCREDSFEANPKGLKEMNRQIIENWNSTVSDGDNVLFLGDLIWLFDQTTENTDQIDRVYNELNGEITSLRGDHDHVKPSHVDEWDYMALVDHEGTEYLAAHFPGNTPNYLLGDGMPKEFRKEYGNTLRNSELPVLHGHHHNNHQEEYPFYNPERNTVNCSIELLEDYSPVSIDRIHDHVQRGQKVETLNS